LGNCTKTSSRLAQDSPAKVASLALLGKALLYLLGHPDRRDSLLDLGSSFGAPCFIITAADAWHSSPPGATPRDTSTSTALASLAGKDVSNWQGDPSFEQHLHYWQLVEILGRESILRVVGRAPDPPVHLPSLINQLYLLMRPITCGFIRGHFNGLEQALFPFLPVINSMCASRARAIDILAAIFPTELEFLAQTLESTTDESSLTLTVRPFTPSFQNRSSRLSSTTSPWHSTLRIFRSLYYPFPPSRERSRLLSARDPSSLRRLPLHRTGAN